MLEVESGVEAIKQKGVRVIRAVIPKRSTLDGTNASETNFRQKYKAAIIAVQRNGKSAAEKLSQTKFQVGDILVLQVSDDSPLLVRPPRDFYRKQGAKKSSSLVKFVRKRISSFGSLSDLGSQKSDTNDDESSVGGSDIVAKDDSSAGNQSQISDPSQPKVGFYVDSDDDDLSISSVSSKKEVRFYAFTVSIQFLSS